MALPSGCSVTMIFRKPAPESGAAAASLMAMAVIPENASRQDCGAASIKSLDVRGEKNIATSMAFDLMSLSVSGAGGPPGSAA